MNIRECMTDPELLGKQFAADSWKPWRTLFAGFYGLPLGDEELTLWNQLTGRDGPPGGPHDELYQVVGRRGGKSNAAAGLAVYIALFSDIEDKLAPGEIASVLLLAADRPQARTLFRYVMGLLHDVPMFERFILREDKESVLLKNRKEITVSTASFRSIRGRTALCCVADELAYWRSEDSANPDYEILNAVRPALATLNGKLVCLSSPYAKRGELWENYRRYYGKESRVLVAQADSRTMNPALPKKVVNRAYDRDPEAARAEYGAQFRTDLEAFVSRGVVEAAVRNGPLELPYDRANKYYAFVDPAGGGADEFALAIGHREDETVVVDLLRARKGVPADIVSEYAEIMKAEYGIREATSDKYAGSWPADEFARHNIEIKHSTKNKSELYLDALAAFNSGRVELPEDPRLIEQLIQLERRTSRAGRDSIDHPPGGHDDRANAVAGLVYTTGTRRYVPLKDWL